LLPTLYPGLSVLTLSMLRRICSTRALSSLYVKLSLVYRMLCIYFVSFSSLMSGSSVENNIRSIFVAEFACFILRDVHAEFAMYLCSLLTDYFVHYYCNFNVCIT